MVVFILIILAGVGITNLVVNASIFDYPRDFVINKSNFLGKLITCMMCSGFWVGLLLGAFSEYNPLYIGAIVSLLSYTYGNLMEHLDILMALNGLKISELETEEDEK